MSYNLTVKKPNGVKVWLNLETIIKLEETPDKHYYIFLVNGEWFEIGSREADKIKEWFEKRI